MKKITKEYIVYDFDELSDEVKEELIEKRAEEEFEFYCDYQLKEDMEYSAEELLKKYFGDKAELKDVYYSLSYCQGDGAMIEFNVNYCNKNVAIKHCGHYYHARCFDICDDYGELTDKQYDKLKEKVIKVNEELEKIGWKLVDADNHAELKEYAVDILREYQYLADGKIFNE